MLGQSDDLDPASDVRTAVVGDVPDHVWAADAGVRDVLTRPPRRARRPRRRWARGHDRGTVRRATAAGRARRAAGPPVDRADDVLLLDEPTNHLDVEGVDWLAAHLRARWPAGRGALVVVTHDRWFLDAVCERTWEVHDGVVDGYDGGYAAYVLARAERAPDRRR